MYYCYIFRTIIYVLRIAYADILVATKTICLISIREMVTIVAIFYDILWAKNCKLWAELNEVLVVVDERNVNKRNKEITYIIYEKPKFVDYICLPCLPTLFCGDANLHTFGKVTYFHFAMNLSYTLFCIGWF